MKSIQHIMCDIYNSKGDKSKQSNVAALIYPDAIRGYGLPRPITHFEKASYGKNDVSYLKFYPSMKDFTADKVEAYVKENSYLAPVAKCVIGENTDIDVFKKYNSHLPKIMYEGMLKHAEQDHTFDHFIRFSFNCDDKYDDKFVCEGEQYNGAEFRKIIEDVEQQCVYVLAHDIYKQTGELINQQWFEDNIFPVLREEYPEDLAEKTISFMNIDKDINERITNRDWSGVDKSVHGITTQEIRLMHEDAGVPVVEHVYGPNIDKKHKGSSFSELLKRCRDHDNEDKCLQVDDTINNDSPDLGL